MEKTGNNTIDKYLELTGQSTQELFAGANQVGMDHVTDVLIPQALKENKKIIWKDTDLETGQGEYLLEDL